MKFNKDRTRQYIDEVFEFIDSATIEGIDQTFYGHPALYFFHSKEEFNTKVDEYLNQEYYDKYDIYYIISRLIKYMLDKYDSHTRVFFNNNYILPIKFKMENNKVYIIRQSPDLENILGSEVIEINGISINKILDEIEDITCYSTKGFLETNQEIIIRNPEMLKSLPSIDNDCETITYKLLYNNTVKEVTIDINNNLKKWDRVTPLNCSYEIIDECMVIHYNECKDKDKMDNLVKEISEIDNVENYIIDLRDNGGGDSKIIEPLLEFLKDKNICAIVNETVFSSGRMAFAQLKNMGAYSVGTDISTSLNAFGNVPGKLDIKELDLIIKRSSSYWLYNTECEPEKFTKENFYDYFKTRKELLEPILLHPDEYVDLSVEDILNNNDVQLKAAIEHFNIIKKK